MHASTHERAIVAIVSFPLFIQWRKKKNTGVENKGGIEEKKEREKMIRKKKTQ